MRSITSYEVAAEVAALTGKEVRVRYGDGYSVGIDDKGIITLTISSAYPYMTPVVRAGILHEACHILYTDGFIKSGPYPTEMLKKAGYAEYEMRPIFDFVNAFEDIRIQLKCEDELPGARFIFQEGNDAMSGPAFTSIMEEEAAGNDFMKARAYLCLAITTIPGYTRLTTVSNKLDEINDNDINVDVHSSALEKMAVYADGTGYLNEVSKVLGSHDWDSWNENFAGKLRDTKTTLEGFELAKSVFMNGYVKLLPKDLQKRYQDQKDFAEMLEALMEAMEKAAKEAQEGCQKVGSALSRISASDEEAEEDMMRKARLPGGFGFGGLRNDQSEFATRIEVIDDIADQMKGYLAPILDRVKEWQERGSDRQRLKRGRVDGTQLYRVAVGDDDVFHREMDPEVTDDVAYSVVIDLSGSMCGDENDRDPLNVAFGIGAGINRALNTIHKPCSVITFSDEAKVVVADKEICTQEKLGDGLNDSMGGTRLDLGVATSLKELDKRSEKLKIQFVISDGDVPVEHLTGTLDKPWKHGVTPYVVYIARSKEHVKHHGAKFEELVQKARADGNALKYAVVEEGEVETLVNQVSKFVESTLEGKKIN